jgi:hypothetical protein
MRTLAKYSAKEYSLPYQTPSASTDEYYPGSGRGDATAIPPRPRERLHRDVQPSIRAASHPHRRALYG